MKLWKKLKALASAHPVAACAGSLALSVGLSYALWAPLVAHVILLVIISHEFAHYVTAKWVDAQPVLPLFIPFGILLWGYTKINNIRVRDIPTVAYAGPVTGISICIFLISWGAAFSVPALVSIAGWVFLWECYALTFGADARQARWAKRVITS